MTEITDQAILDAAKITASMMWQEFEPLDNREVGLIKQRNPQFEIVAGAVRQFTTEDIASKSLINLLEVRLYETNGEASSTHNMLVLGFEHAYDDYLVKVELSSGQIDIETNKACGEYKADKYPTIGKRILLGFTSVADQLF